MPDADNPGGTGGLAPLPTLPIFFKLQDRRVLMAGGGEPAVWKAEVLCAAGAQVELVATDICAGLRDLAARLGPDVLCLSERPWRDEDFCGAALALGAIEDDGEAARFRDAAHRAGVPVNVVDKPAFCDFQFGTLVSRGPLVVAITTDGAAPVVGQAIRARFEALLPDGLTAWAQAAKTWRRQVQGRGWDFRRRRKFWEAFADLALASAECPPTEHDLETCLAAVEAEPATGVGSVTLVGSGPGTAEALTFAAARGLQSAEMLIFEAALPQSLVSLARREAIRAPVVDDASGVASALAEASAGKRVVWLGTGNPGTCQRWHDRSAQLLDAGLTVSRIDGLSNCPYCAGRCPGRVEAEPFDLEGFRLEP